MSNCTLKSVTTPAEAALDPLTEVLRSGARNLIKQAVEAEISCNVISIRVTQAT